LIVEGRTDEAIVSGVGDRDGGLPSLGIAVVRTDGKAKIPLAWAILEELGVPTYVMFDGDRGLVDKMRERGREEGDIAAQERNVARQNQSLTRLLGGPEMEWPETMVGDRYAVFAGQIEDLWPDAVDEARRLAEQAGDWRAKSDDGYREAAQDPGLAVPPEIEQILAAVRALR
jgi:hypothetical protein